MLVQVQESLTINPSSDSGSSGSGNSKRLPTLDTTPESTPITTFTPTIDAIKEEDSPIPLKPTEKPELEESSHTEETNEVPVSVIQKIKNVAVSFIDILQETLTRIINKLF